MSTPQISNPDLNQQLSPETNENKQKFPKQQPNSGFSSKLSSSECAVKCKEKCGQLCKDVKCKEKCANMCKCEEICKHIMKISVIISIISLLVTMIAAISIATTLKARISELETNPSAYGIVNVNETYSPGGYFGWMYSSNFPYLYPLPDLHVHIGDRIFFTAKLGTSEDLWLVPKQVYDSCNFTNKTDQIQLAIAKWIRADTYLHNESCISNITMGCQNGWILNEYPYNSDGGYTFLVQDWHIQKWGNPLYFASAREWDNWKDYKNHGCLNGIKLKVFLEKRKAIPLLEDDGSSFEISALHTVEDLSVSIAHLSRMLILQQFNFEQRIRSQGDSGLTNVRGTYDGDAAYDDGVYTNGAVASIHNHADNILIVGIGEISAVLNGVEFQTRHNDYNLRMPSTTHSQYGATERIQYPDVPPSVVGSVNNQIAEMQEYFRAFKNQDTSHRDYTPYFRPILCYLEGTWILDDNTLYEPFESDRHKIDASTWKQLHDQIRWMTNSGRKNIKENLAHLPSSIRNLVNNTYPIVSNWEYRIVCHPLQNNIPTARFRIVDDLAVQLLGSPETREELYYSRRARFELNKYININNIENDIQWTNGRKEWNYLDYLMEQIPGKDNYMANLTDELPGTDGIGTHPALHYMTNEPINAGYYSRYYKLFESDAMGSTKHRRGFNDRYLFAAATTQTKVSPIELNHHNHTIISRWSYAIPFEIIYLTPITNWNPYNIQHYEKEDFDDSKTGKCSKSEAYNGWTDKNAYFTPADFFSAVTFASAGDTVSDNVCAIGDDGDFHTVFASGHWINFPDIGGDVGIVRQRYPIFPIHSGGSNTYKEIKALQTVVLPTDYDSPTAYPDGFFGNDRDLIYGFEVNLQGGGHQHVVYIQGWKVRNKWYNSNKDEWLSSVDNIVEVEADERNNHEHTIELWREQDTQTNEWIYYIKRCRYGTVSESKKYKAVDWTALECDDNHNLVKR